MNGVPGANVKLESFKNSRSYSSLAVQLGAKAYSMPTPPTGPSWLLLLEMLIEPPVVTSVSVGLLTPAQPQPPFASISQGPPVPGFHPPPHAPPPMLNA